MTVPKFQVGDRVRLRCDHAVIGVVTGEQELLHGHNPVAVNMFVRTHLTYWPEQLEPAPLCSSCVDYERIGGEWLKYALNRIAWGHERDRQHQEAWTAGVDALRKHRDRIRELEAKLAEANARAAAFEACLDAEDAKPAREVDESPPFTPAALGEFAARGFRRENRKPARETDPPPMTHDRLRPAGEIERILSEPAREVVGWRVKVRNPFPDTGWVYASDVAPEGRYTYARCAAWASDRASADEVAKLWRAKGFDVRLVRVTRRKP